MKIMSGVTIVPYGSISLIIHKSEFKNLREFNKMFTEMTKIIENDSDAKKWGWADLMKLLTLKEIIFAYYHCTKCRSHLWEAVIFSKNRRVNAISRR